MNNPAVKHSYDIAIVGGGMVGAVLALALARGQQGQHEPLRILVLEAFPLPVADNQPLQPSYDARSTALSLGSRHIFERLGVWSALAVDASPIHRIQVSDRGHLGVLRLDAAKERVPALGSLREPIAGNCRWRAFGVMRAAAARQGCHRLPTECADRQPVA